MASLDLMTMSVLKWIVRALEFLQDINYVYEHFQEALRSDLRCFHWLCLPTLLCKYILMCLYQEPLNKKDSWPHKKWIPTSLWHPETCLFLFQPTQARVTSAVALYSLHCNRQIKELRYRFPREMARWGKKGLGSRSVSLIRLFTVVTVPYLFVASCFFCAALSA